MVMKSSSSNRVCVTGGSGYIGSWLVKKLLLKGHTVHATLRNLNDSRKVDLLKSFEGAEKRLVLFEADIYKPEEFEHAMNGCEFVFHVATPFQHTDSCQYKSTTEAAIAGAKSILKTCVRSGTVRRLIYTATVVAASPLTDDGTAFKASIDETCWTSLNLSFPFCTEHIKDYADSKTLTEKEILNYGKDGSDCGVEVVSLACGLVGGETVLSYAPLSVAMFYSMITNRTIEYESLRFLEELLGKIPIIHINDLCEAHVFCMDSPSINGRFLCASSYVSSAEIARYYQKNYPEFHMKSEYLDGPKREIEWGSTKLKDKGFEYKYNTKMILDDCIKCARRLGDLQP